MVRIRYEFLSVTQFNDLFCEECLEVIDLNVNKRITDSETYARKTAKEHISKYHKNKELEFSIGSLK